jgi:hypothetical protein
MRADVDEDGCAPAPEDARALRKSASAPKSSSSILHSVSALAISLNVCLWHEIKRTRVAFRSGTKLKFLGHPQGLTVDGCSAKARSGRHLHQYLAH